MSVLSFSFAAALNYGNSSLLLEQMYIDFFFSTVSLPVFSAFSPGFLIQSDLPFAFNASQHFLFLFFPLLLWCCLSFIRCLSSLYNPNVWACQPKPAENQLVLGFYAFAVETLFQHVHFHLQNVFLRLSILKSVEAASVSVSVCHRVCGTN